MNLKIVVVLSALSCTTLSLDSSRDARILKYDFENTGTGPYRFQFETSDGISRIEQGDLVNENTEDEHLVVRGSYSYTDETGQVYTVHYVADDNGFHPEGDHIKVPPFVPWVKGQPHDDGHPHQHTHGSSVQSDEIHPTKGYLPSTPSTPLALGTTPSGPLPGLANQGLYSSSTSSGPRPGLANQGLYSPSTSSGPRPGLVNQGLYSPSTSSGPRPGLSNQGLYSSAAPSGALPGVANQGLYSPSTSSGPRPGLSNQGLYSSATPSGPQPGLPNQLYSTSTPSGPILGLANQGLFPSSTPSPVVQGSSVDSVTSRAYIPTRRSVPVLDNDLNERNSILNLLNALSNEREKSLTIGAINSL